MSSFFHWEARHVCTMSRFGTTATVWRMSPGLLMTVPLNVGERELQTDVLVQHLPLPGRFLDHEREGAVEVGVQPFGRELERDLGHHQRVPGTERDHVHAPRQHTVRALDTRERAGLASYRVQAPGAGAPRD